LRFRLSVHWTSLREKRFTSMICPPSRLPWERAAGKLLSYIGETARAGNCDQVYLDSGCGPHRYNSPRLYLKTGFNITSFFEMNSDLILFQHRFNLVVFFRFIDTDIQLLEHC
jgi:hypothetical protein